MTTYNISNAFCFYFFGCLSFYNAICIHYIIVMQNCMGNFMDTGFHGLEITHSCFNRNIFFCLMIIAFCLPVYFHKPYWYR